jgi:dihydroorotate dehydrogenase
MDIMPSLKIRLNNGLELADPFIVASSHLTASKEAFENLSVISPSAVTIKTISKNMAEKIAIKKVVVH